MYVRPGGRYFTLLPPQALTSSPGRWLWNLTAIPALSYIWTVDGRVLDHTQLQVHSFVRNIFIIIYYTTTIQQIYYTKSYHKFNGENMNSEKMSHKYVIFFEK